VYTTKFSPVYFSFNGTPIHFNGSPLKITGIHFAWNYSFNYSWTFEVALDFTLVFKGNSTQN
jgi:hypothetical protein